MILKIFYLQSLLLLWLLMPFAGQAQKTEQVEILNADTFEGDENLGKNVARLTGDVRFRHRGALMYCDSAYMYQDANSLDAFGKVKIVQGDSIRLTGNLLKYDGNTRVARVIGNVVLNDRTMQLETAEVVYKMNDGTAFYETPGVITDRENKLTSFSGYYISKDKMLYFRDSVVLTNPDYIILADTLQYNTVSRIATFLGPSTITSTGTDSTVMFCSYGWYDTVNKKSMFTRRAHVQSKSSTLTGDSLLFDSNAMIGKAFGSVELADTVNKVLITGAYGYSNDKKKRVYVTGKATLIKIFDVDSLFLHADTLFAFQDTVTRSSEYVARRNVKFFKPDIQGACDTLTYSTADSLVRLIGNPVMWNDSSQLTAHHMQIQIANNQVTTLYMYQSAFIISREDSVRYNQVKGRDMTGYFTENKLTSIKVEGNGQSVYYSRNKKQQLVGVNRADCSDMLIILDENKVKSISLINQPDATLFPILELPPNELILSDFVWIDGERPADKEAIYRPRSSK